MIALPFAAAATGPGDTPRTRRSPPEGFSQVLAVSLHPDLARLLAMPAFTNSYPVQRQLERIGALFATPGATISGRINLDEGSEPSARIVARTTPGRGGTQESVLRMIELSPVGDRGWLATMTTRIGGEAASRGRTATTSQVIGRGNRTGLFTTETERQIGEGERIPLLTRALAVQNTRNGEYRSAAPDPNLLCPPGSRLVVEKNYFSGLTMLAGPGGRPRLVSMVLRTFAPGATEPRWQIDMPLPTRGSRALTQAPRGASH